MKNVSHYVGLPFKDLGRDRSGLDCHGLVRLFYQQEFNIALPSYLGEYSSSMDGEEIEALVRRERETTWTPVDSPRFGDVVILRINGMPWHCGVILDRERFLHIERGLNACIDRLTSPRWKRRIDGFYRHTSLCDMEHA